MLRACTWHSDRRPTRSATADLRPAHSATADLRSAHSATDSACEKRSRNIALPSHHLHYGNDPAFLPRVRLVDHGPVLGGRLRHPPALFRRQRRAGAAARPHPPRRRARHGLRVDGSAGRHVRGRLLHVRRHGPAPLRHGPRARDGPPDPGDAARRAPRGDPALAPGRSRHQQQRVRRPARPHRHLRVGPGDARAHGGLLAPRRLCVHPPLLRVPGHVRALVERVALRLQPARALLPPRLLADPRVGDDPPGQGRAGDGDDHHGRLRAARRAARVLRRVDVRHGGHGRAHGLRRALAREADLRPPQREQGGPPRRPPALPEPAAPERRRPDVLAHERVHVRPRARRRPRRPRGVRALLLRF
mmetsp:Transcript_5388/g.17672  ORF Transcript_5388/g.17672 Transcript_5388/m.17672 type:complete len:361 (+) Transcript_5388:37-1119(+)